MHLLCIPGGKIMKKMAYAGAISFLLMAPAVMAQTGGQPDHLKSCKPLATAGASASVAPPATPTPVLSEARLYDCFTITNVDFYGTGFISFNNDRMDIDSFINAKRSDQKRSLLARIGSIFVSNSKTVTYVAKMTLQPGDGTPNIDVGTFPLMSISKSNTNGHHYDVAKLTVDCMQGNAFYANTNSKLMVELAYVPEVINKSEITKIIAAADLLRLSLGALTSVKTIAPEIARDLQAANDKIVSIFNSYGQFKNTVILGFNAKGLQAFRAVTTLGDLLPASSGGLLYLAAYPVPTILLDDAYNDSATPQRRERNWDASGTGPITARVLNGARLREQVKLAMGTSFAALASGRDENGFLDACATLTSVLADTGFSLVSDDRIAATWAFTAENPLMGSYSVRHNYCLAPAEANGTLKRLGLTLPTIPSRPLTDSQKQIMVQARAAADVAETSQVTAQSIINEAAAAETHALLWPTPAGFVAREVFGIERFSGPAPASGLSIKGALTETDTIRDHKGNRYLGELTLSGVRLVPNGRGQFVSGSINSTFPFTSYAGTFVDGVFSGHGLMQWPNARRFAGGFARNLPNGYGVLTLPTNERYYVFMTDGVATGTSISEIGGTRIAGTGVAGAFVPD